jgi:four helix bundle protein
VRFNDYLNLLGFAHARRSSSSGQSASPLRNICHCKCSRGLTSTSKAEFVAKLNVSIQEADESSLWLELLTEDCGVAQSLVAPALQETNELIAILTTIVKRST